MSNYSDKDIIAIRARLVEMIRAETSLWTDFNESDIGMVFVEVLAACSDLLNYYLDRQTQEVYLDRAVEPKNIRSILQTMNYRIPFIIPATGQISFINPNSEITNDVIIPRYTQLTTSTGDIKQFITTEAVTLVGRSELVVAPIMQGTRVTVEESVTRLKADWKYYLNVTSLADESVRVIDSRGEWEEVDDAFLKYEGGRYFSVHKDPHDKIYILFTWDWVAQLPDNADELVTIYYISTLGSVGKTEPYTIDRILDRLYDVTGVEVTNALIPINRERVSGGSDEPGLYKMITDARNQVKTMDKLVTLSDYSAAAAATGGVMKSVTQDWSVPNNEVKQPYKVISWVIGHDIEPLSSAFLSLMSRDIYSRGIAIVEYNAVAAELIKFTVSLQIKIKSSSNEFRSEVRQLVITNLTNAFGFGNMEFGQTISVEDIRRVAGDSHVSITEVIMVEPLVDTILLSIQYPVMLNALVEIVGDEYGF